MSWRDNSSSSNRSSTNDGNGGSRNGGGGVSGTGGGGGGWGGGGRNKGGSMYTYRGMGKNKQGNWNTGGAITGFGSLDGGIMPVAGMSKHMGVPQPAGNPMVQPPMIQPPMPPVPGVAPPIIDDGVPPGTVTDVYGQPVRMDPGIIGQMLNGIGAGPVSPYGNMGTFNGKKDQSRMPGMGGPQRGGMGGMRGGWNGGGGRNGGGYGGGGGGGW